MDDRREARAAGGRRFQREGTITAKDLDMAMVVLVRGTTSSRLSMAWSVEHEGKQMNVLDTNRDMELFAVQNT